MKLMHKNNTAKYWLGIIVTVLAIITGFITLGIMASDPIRRIDAVEIKQEVLEDVIYEVRDDVKILIRDSQHEHTHTKN